MDVPPALVLAGAVLGGFVQGLSGFAFALVATVFWSGVLPPQVAVPLLVACSLAAQLMSIRTVWPSLDLRQAAPMVGGGLVGVPLGVLVLPLVDPAAFRTGVGVLLLVYCPAMLFAQRLPRVTAGGRWADGAAGLVGGMMGGIGGLAGPAPTLWCALRGWDRDTQRAMFQSFLVVSQAAAVVGFIGIHAYTPKVLWTLAWALPLTLLPSLIGQRFYAGISPEAFRRLILILLMLTGLALLLTP